MHVRLVQPRGFSHAFAVLAVASRALTGKQLRSGALGTLLSVKRIADCPRSWRRLMDQRSHPSPRGCDQRHQGAEE